MYHMQANIPNDQQRPVIFFCILNMFANFGFLFFSRPSSKACRLPYVDTPRPLPPGEKESGGSQCDWTGVSNPTSQSSGHSCTQSEVLYIMLTHIVYITCNSIIWTYRFLLVRHLFLYFDHIPYVRSRSVSGASTGLSSSPLSSPRVRASWTIFNMHKYCISLCMVAVIKHCLKLFF